MTKYSDNDTGLEKYRREFPVTDSYIYLDNAGVAPVSLRVGAAVAEFLKEASSLGFAGYAKWMERVERVRGLSARLVGAGSDEIAFVKNTSHGISIVAGGLDWKDGDNVVVFEKDFPTNIYPWLALERKGVSVRYIPLGGDGRISIKDIERLTDSRTRLISISTVQALNGFMMDPGELKDFCSRRGVLLFLDAIQSLGAVPMEVDKYGADFLSADGHKWMLAPEGTGIFYCRKERAGEIYPSLIGWKSVVHEAEFERVELTLKEDALRFEEGSYNVMGIIALGAALDLLFEAGIERVHSRILDLGDLVIAEADRRGFEVRSPRERDMRGGIVSFAGPFDPKKVKAGLMTRRIVVNERGGALRMAPHFYNTEEEILRAFEGIDGLAGRS
ncbi:MAG TPA: aminotransferase class V-fold PLP-dependent enzyme [Thermodesulfobacteriota bacterium]|nr:aminotransferase class V-fold PLP-dependent enzyme [Thermodesulfobacteriota bacterium]